MLSNIRKFCFYLKKSGIRQTVFLVGGFVFGKLRCLWFRIMASIFFKSKMKNLSDEIKGKTVMVFTPSVEWNFLFQRAQQLSEKFAEKPSVAVVYLTTQTHYDNFFAVRKLKPDLYLVNSSLASRLDKCLDGAKDVVSCVYNISYAYMLDQYHSDKIEYEYVDDLIVTASGVDNLEEKRKVHDLLLERSDLVVATASKLLNEIKDSCKKVILAPNAVDYDFFSKNVSVAPQIAEVRKKYSCVLMYYGALASWFDYDVVKKTAEARPDWCWVLIGKKIDNYMEKSGIQTIENVIYIPAVPYKELPSYAAGADILTIPFVLNEITEATSPVKLFEYMAAGKPIITSDMPECRLYKSVNIYSSPEHMIKLVQECLVKKDDEGYKSVLRKEALENTWDVRADMILNELGIAVKDGENQCS